MFKALLLFLLLFLGYFGMAQTCTIIAAGTVCKDELMSFEVTSSGNIQSVLWDMGDASSSTQTLFSHNYSSPGLKTIKVTVNLVGGGSCNASTQVRVYDLPKIKITKKADNNYCLFKNNVCLIDSSLGGDSGVVIKKRIIIWDDGGQDLTNYPAIGDKMCHHYNNYGTFKVTIELTNDKDCKTQITMDIVIVKDVVPKMYVYTIDNETARLCDSALTFFQDINYDTSTIISKVFDWGDGTVVTSKSRKIAHHYKQTGFYKVSLTYNQTNGCSTTKDTQIFVEVFSVKFNITRNATKQCAGSVFRFTQLDGLSGAWYYWKVDNIIYEWDQDLKMLDMTPELGKKLISLEIYNYGCFKVHKYDTIEVIGYSANITVHNDNQCDNKDTVYFKAKVKQYGVGKINYLWDFGDDSASMCTVSRLRGNNLNNNCNYSTDSIATHFYEYGICRTYHITIQDSLQVCAGNTFVGSVNTIRPDTIKFDYTANRLCLGNKSDYYIGFHHNMCSSIKLQVNLDSACDRDRFSTRFVNSIPYLSTCNKEGWVTVGLAIEFGSGIVYTGFNDTSDFYEDKSRICYDTLWKHNWFRLSSEPDASFTPNVPCIKEDMTPSILKPIQKNISFSRWHWGDNKIDTLLMPTGDSIIPQPKHKYQRAGNFYLNHYLENSSHCYNEAAVKIVLGFKMRVDFDTVICPGSIVIMKDSMWYEDSSLIPPNLLTVSKNYWHDKNRKLAGREEFKWNFDDGKGFLVDTANPVIRFPNVGFYRIKLAAKDSLNCWDTLSKLVNVGGVHAGIKNIYKRIICDGIVQLYDSSFSDYKPPTDSITRFYWEFGDGGNPSYLRNPYHYYSTFGDYTVFQRVENSRGCADSAYFKFSIEGPVAKFKITGDTVGCAPFTAKFENTSIKTKDYIWYFGDPLNTKLFTNKDTIVGFTYTLPGTYYIYLFGSDSVKNPNAGNAVYYCKTLFPDTNILNHPVRKIIVLPAPKADFNVNFIQCIGQPINVTSTSDSLYKRHKWTIKNIDSVDSPNKLATLNSKDTGNYKIVYTPYYPPIPPLNISCYDTVIKSIRLTSIKAEFNLIKDTSSCPVFEFINKTKNYKSITWNMDDSLAGAAKNIHHNTKFTYKYENAQGSFTPCLFTENSDGCFDTLCTTVNVDFVVKLIIPNVFTPGNNDKLNDAFDIVAEGLDEYNLAIYNRWGQKIFETEVDGIGDDGNNWKGRPNVVSDLYPDGTYFYIFNYKYKCEDKKQEAHGIITLIGKRD